MDDDRWRRIEELFHRAAGLAPMERAQHLDSACAGDDDLRRQVESLLANDRSQDSVLGPAVARALQELPAGECRDALLGKQIGPYLITALIGAGGMGRVYSADDRRLRRKVALKSLPDEVSSDLAAMDRFRREARTLSALNHPNICSVYDIVEQNNRTFIVMEYVDGAALKGPLSPEATLKYARQICEALEAAHQKGFIHRDLKPANIQVTHTGIKLLDFGLARVVRHSDESTLTNDLSMVNSLMGTPAYMSPEQAEGKPVDERSDIFSFGAVLYEMLSGKRAFTGDSTASLISAVLRDDPAPLGLAPAVERIITRCLKKAPAQRFQTAAELKRALELCDLRGATQQPSIAVLPFANMSSDKDNEYFSDGLAEEIINVLAHIPGLKVIARTSAFAFRGKEEDIRRIANILDVITILEGSVRRSGNRIRVTAQLIKAEDGSHLWSERYDREMADVFAVQDEIAAAIAGALKVKLAAEHAASPQQRAPNLAAYDALLRARHHCDKLTPDSMTRACECLQQAILLDPGYALPHSELGTVFSTQAQFGILSAHEAMPQAREYLQRALAIDPTLPEPLATLAYITTVYDYDWKEAERLFQLAMKRGPIQPRVRQIHGVYLLLAGRIAEAIEQLERALPEDPLNISGRMYLEFTLLIAQRWAEAADQCRRLVELDENYHRGYFHMSVIHYAQGALQEAIAWAEKAHSRAPWVMLVTGFLAGLLARNGDAARAKEILQKMGDGSAYNAPAGLVIYFLVISEFDLATQWAARAIEQRDPAIVPTLRTPIASELRASSRWPALAKMLKLPDFG